jgi:tripartite-type tricarboxylate transporter receptor subunit TctC
MIRWTTAPFALAVAMLALTAQPVPCHAQTDFPRKSVRLIVPIPPGGGTDTIARLVAPKVSEVWGQPVVVENQGGGGTTIGTNNAVKSPPDGYTLLLTSLSVAYAPALYRNLPYDTEKDLAPILLLATQPSMLVVHPSLPARSLAELIALAKSRGGEILYSSGGNGSPSHLAVELLRAHANIKLVHVPYKGGGPAGVAAVTGETQMTITNVSSLLPHVRAGKLRALAVTGATRAKAAPELPTVKEAGLPRYEFEVWYGLLAPARTPAAVQTRINEDFNRALAARDIQERFAGLGIEAAGGTQPKFTAHLSSEIRKWNQVVKEAGIRSE